MNATITRAKIEAGAQALWNLEARWRAIWTPWNEAGLVARNRYFDAALAVLEADPATACACPVPGTRNTVRASCPVHGESA